MEARPDLVRGVPKGDSGGSPSENNDENGREDPDDPPKDDKGSSDTPSTESQLPTAPESSESHNLDNQPLSNANIWHSDHKNVMVSIPPGFLKKQDTVLLVALEFFAVHVLPLCVGSLYIIWNYSWDFRQAF